MFRLELAGITKRYPGVTANEDVSLQLRPGELHAVLGENGAGKSTLMKIIHGAVRPDAGQMRWNGTLVQLASPRQARALGIAMVYQHFALFEQLSVAENVWLGLERGLTLAETAQQITTLGEQLDLPLSPERPVHALSMGERQRVELLRALLARPQLLILDEPTSVLAPGAVSKLFQTLRRLAQSGCAVLYVSHKLAEIRALCESCTVLRGGRVMGRVNPQQESPASLARLMIGAEPPAVSRAERARGELCLALRQLSLPAREASGVGLRDVSLQVHRGEVVGVAGVSGNGQHELFAALSGEDERLPAGHVRLFGAELAGVPPAQRRALGLRLVPEERLGRATVPGLSLAWNGLLTRREAVRRWGWLDGRALHQQAAHIVRRFNVTAPSSAALASSLSGGNLQKFVVGREVDAQPRLLLLAQPTWGVDVGAAAQIRQQLLALRDQGCALLVVSEDLDELFELSDALVVMAAGRLSPRLPRARATVERIGEWMGGSWPQCNDVPSGTGGADV